jgi:MFS family permease
MTVIPDLAELKQGWKILLLSVMGIAISINAVLLYGFGTLVVPFEQAFSWDRSAIQVAITFLYGGAVIGLQLVGWLNLRFGLKTVTVVSLLTMALGYLACTWLIGGSIWTLYIAFALLPIIGMGALAVTWTQLLNLWFLKNRGLALAIGLSGTGMTAAVVPNVMAWCVELWGWQAPFVMLCLVNLLMIPVTLLWFNLPEVQIKQSRSTRKVATQSIEVLPTTEGLSFREGSLSRNFWICNISLSLVVAAVVGMVTNTVPMLMDRGYSVSEATMVFSTFGFSLITGRLFVGYLLDRLWPPGVAAVSLIMPAFGCLIYLLGDPSFAMLSLAIALIGLGAGAEFDIAAFLIARYFGLREYGRLFGLHQSLITVSSALAPLLFAAMLGATCSYTAMLVFCSMSTLIGALLLLFLGPLPQFKTQT